MLFQLFQWLRWRKWKKKALVAMQDCLTVQCAICFDHIVPGDFFGELASGELVHAGYHFTLTERNAFCETGGVGTGYWNGERAECIRESAVEKVFRTEETQVGEY